MRRWLAPLVLLAFTLGCSDDNSLNSTDDATLREQGEDAAVIAAGAVALNSGGLLEGIETALDDDAEGPGGGAPDFAKDRAGDEAVFDSSTCTWTITHTRSADHGDAGFHWNLTRTLHFMDEAGECVETRGDSLIRALDLTRSVSGESWNPRHEGSKTATGIWALRGLRDDEPGVLVNGTHEEEGEGIVHRARPGGGTRDVVYTYTLSLVGTDLVIIRVDGRRVPVAGTIQGVYDAVRNGRTIHREFTIVFGEGGGTVDMGDGLTFVMDPVSGAVN